MRKNVTTSGQFALRSAEIHGLGRYNYENVNYISCYTHVSIKCMRCETSFQQTPTHHLSGRGCFKCNLADNTQNQRDNISTFVVKARRVHNELYDYANVVYINSTTKVVIECRSCNSTFEQRPSAHLAGQGCPKCAYNRVALALKDDKATFILKATELNNISKFDYSFVEYVSSMIKIIIRCLKCDIKFEQTPSNHLAGHGCPKCASKHRCSQNKWLDSIGIPDDPEHREVKNLLFDKRFVVDGFDPETRTVYEFLGDRWHGNPELYHDNELLIGYIRLNDTFEVTVLDTVFEEVYVELSVSANERQLEDAEREKAFRTAGFNVVIMWENDWKRMCKNTRALNNV